MKKNRIKTELRLLHRPSHGMGTLYVDVWIDGVEVGSLLVAYLDLETAQNIVSGKEIFNDELLG